MRYLLIMNPGSKSGVSRRKFQKIFCLMDQKGIRYDVKITKNLEDAYRFSVEGNHRGYDVIVAVGGDGTINQVLNGFYDDDGGRRSHAKMGVVYTGTSPDFCKSYGIPIQLEKAVEVLTGHRSKEIQVGKITMATSYKEALDNQPISEEGIFTTRYFACCANIGLGVALARRANAGIRGVVGDVAGTFLALVKTLMRYKPSDFMVCRDGKTERIEKVQNISVGKTYYIASGMKVKHDLQHGDDRFYCLTVKKMKPWHWASAIWKVYSGKPIKNTEVITLESLKTFEVYGNGQNPEVEFDGDPAGFLPCRIQMADGLLALICENAVLDREGIGEKALHPVS